MMKKTFGLMLMALVLSSTLGCAQLFDDFSQGGWKQFSTTPGTLTVKPGCMHLQDGKAPPNWITASKVFTVDFDKTPFFVTKVGAVSNGGTVKLIHSKPYDKRVAIKIDRPGFYAVGMRSQFGWRGVGEVEVCLYANGMEEEITFEYVAFMEQLAEREQALIKERKSAGNITLNVPPFAVVPLFNACSVYFRSPKRDTLSVLYRKKGGEWLKALQPAYMEEDKMYRGSVVSLDEDTPYELKILGGEGEILARKDFRTWASEVPVAKTIVLDEENFDGHIAIVESGSPDGWIRYVSRDGFVLRNDRKGPLVELYKAKYVLLEGLTLRGGHKEAIAVRKCEYVRIVNCDIAGWGRIGTQRFDIDGKFYTKDGAAINWDSAILVSRSVGTVVERCYIHDPVSTANPWYYSHPSGPQAVGIDKPMSTVLRYNDFIGSDIHRWNDAVEGAGNFQPNGGFNRDADIYGNMMCFANDDAIEIDGGQTNVRVFLNKFEGCLCGVSIQGCMSSPSYVFRNLIVNMGDEHGIAGQTIKTSSHANGRSAVSFLFNNTCHGESSDLSLPGNLRIVAKNNIFNGRTAIHGRKRSPQSECDYNLLSTGEEADEEHGILGKPVFVDSEAALFAPRKTSPAVGRGVAIDNFAPATNGSIDMGAIPLGSDLVLPVRPIPIYLDRYQLTFTAANTKAERAQTVTVTVKGGGFSSQYRIAKNDAFDWFTVTPDHGVLESGKTTELTVTPIPARMKERKIYRGAFLVRLESGFSRPVMVYAKTDVVPVMKPSRKSVFVKYIEAEAPSSERTYKTISDASASGGKCALVSDAASKEPAEYRFSVPKAGKYYVLMRLRSEEPVGSHNSVRFCMDDGELATAQVRSAASWVWSMVAHNRRQRLTCLQAFSLSAAEHVLKLAPRESVYIDLIAITDNPRMFD